MLCFSFLLYKRGIQHLTLLFHCGLGGMQLILHRSDLHLAKARQFVLFVLCRVLILALNSFLINMLLKALFLRQDQFSFGGWVAPVWGINVLQRPSGVRKTDMRVKRKLVCIQVSKCDVKHRVSSRNYWFLLCLSLGGLWLMVGEKLVTLRWKWSVSG